MTERSARAVRSTYRLQLSVEFGFAAARELVPYFASLGVSHLYLSPILQARPGSPHGYDVTDPTLVSRELGGEDGLRALARAAHDAGVGLVVDIVPNHLGVAPENRDWQFLLAEGQSGEGSRVFDVDWHPPLPGADGKVLLPVLGDQYGTVLRNGELEVVEEPDADGRRFRVHYHDHAFPLSPESLEAMERVGRIDSLRGTPGMPETWNRLHALLERQHYRLVHWRIGDRVVNYRRFFAITDLAGVRVEDEHVFERTHAKILELVSDGVIDGLRVDHPDGLRDPAQYLTRLARRSGGVWTVVEKILHPGEALPQWTAAGTTGYEFCNDVLGLFVDPRAQDQFAALDAALDADARHYAEQVEAAKREVLAQDLAAEFQRLVRRLWTVAQEHLDIRDVDDRHCVVALADTLVAMPVYRTYVDPQTAAASPRDVEVVTAAIEGARRHGRAPAYVLDFLAEVLTGAAGDSAPHLELISRFQQLSGALTAKGVEDTVFYRYLRMVALNEVGGEPTRFGLGVDGFHRRNAQRAADHPAGMLTTATHDTKRGEDVRLRIAALTELPDRWAQLAIGLTRDSGLDRPTAAFLLQTMVGSWPLPDSSEATPDYRERLVAYATKAARESGLHTNWYDPDAAYEQLLAGFVDEILSGDQARKEVAELAAAAAEIGMVASLAQVVLRTVSPGVPDAYWGNELWDDSLVDPDNRRPVDWERRRALLSTVVDADVAQLWQERRDGRIKLRVLADTLRVRNGRPGAFDTSAGYVPLQVTGRWEEHVVAFARSASGEPDVIAVVPRLPGAVMGPDLGAPVGEQWADTAVELPARAWVNVFTGEQVDNGSLGSLLRLLPVGVFAPL